MNPSQQLMLKIAIQLRAMQLFYHQSHHVVKNSPFFSDHEALGGFYEDCESAYDRIAERIVGMYGTQPLNLQMIVGSVNEKIKTLPSESTENKALFQAGLKLEEELQQMIEMVCKSGIPQGTIQAVGDEADKSMIRTYKLKRRTS